MPTKRKKPKKKLPKRITLKLRRARGKGPVRGNENLYKTVLCDNYSRYGNCRYNRRCQFAHGIEELRDRPLYCPPASQPPALRPRPRQRPLLAGPPPLPPGPPPLPPGPPPRSPVLVHFTSLSPSVQRPSPLYSSSKGTPRLPIFQNLTEKEYTRRLPVFIKNLKEYAGKKKKKTKRKR